MDERAWQDRLDRDGSLELRHPPGSRTPLVVVGLITAVSVVALFSDDALNRWSGWVGIVVFGLAGIPLALHATRSGYPRTHVDEQGLAVSVRLHPLDRDRGWQRPWSGLRRIQAQSGRADAVITVVDDAGTPFTLPTYPDVDAGAWARWLEAQRRRRA